MTLAEWPTADLETVDACPVCKSERRSVLYENLTDKGFGVAPGSWKLWRCLSCKSAYLNPRPTEASIHRAYASYYTHGSEFTKAKTAPEKGEASSLKYRLGNGYRNWRYGTRFPDAYPLGAVFGRLLPFLGHTSDELFRWLPNPKSTSRGRLLDVGCGDGTFLRLANFAGWQACGCDPDPSAREVAAAHGVEVRDGGPEAWLDQSGQFDAVTMSHVIEHFHDPVTALRQVTQLVRPGGTLYIETPNIEAASHKIFNDNWFGLEAPRHVTLFSRYALTRLIMQNSLSNIQYKRRSKVFTTMCLRSARITAGHSPFRSVPEHELRQLPWLNRVRSDRLRGKGSVEFLTVVCRK